MLEITYALPSGRVLLEHTSNIGCPSFDFAHIAKLFPECLPGQVCVWRTESPPIRKRRRIEIGANGKPSQFNEKTDTFVILGAPSQEILRNASFHLVEPVGKECEELQKGPLIIWRGPVYSATGYAGMNREIVRRLVTAGLNVKFEAFPSQKQIDSAMEEFINSRLRKATDAPDVVVTGYVPVPSTEDEAFQVSYTMLESTTAHHEFVRRCNESADEVWVPNSDNLRAMKESGLVKPARVIPLGVDTEFFHPCHTDPFNPYLKRISDLAMCKPEGFRFLSVFRWAKSKGPDVLVKAFRMAFGDSEEAHLVIYSHSRYAKWMQDSIRGYLGGALPGNIYIYNDVVPSSAMPGVYKAADAFVLTTRGEGMGLPILEAASMGLPIVAGYNTAMLDYLSEETAYLIHIDRLEDAPDDLAITTPYYRGQKFPVYGDEAVKEAASHMRHVFENREEAADKAAKAMKNTREEYDWSKCSERVINALEKCIKADEVK
jgi:glycosyltransferase involved in cell wall biosynthesis